MSARTWLLTIPAVMLLVLFAGACGDDPDTSTDASDTQMDTTGGVDGPSWDAGVADIFAARCSICHGWALDYALVTVETEKLQFKIENGHGGLSDEELAEIVLWLDNGAPR